MNLGAFAAGAVDGYNRMEKLKLEQQNQANLDKRAQREEEEYTFTKAERERAKAAKADIEKLYSEFSDVATGQPSVGPDGKPVQMTPAQLAARQASFNSRLIGVKLKHGQNVDQNELNNVFTQAREMLKTEEGQTIYKALSGDGAALETLAGKAGLNPANIKYQKDPKTGAHVLTDGAKTVDVSMYALGAGVYDVMKPVLERDALERGVQKHNLDMATDQFRLDKVMPAQVNASNAAAGASAASAEVNRAYASNLRDGLGKTGKAADTKYLASAEKVAPRSMDDPKSADPEAVGTIATIAAAHFNGEKNPEIAVAKAAKLYGPAASHVDSIIKGRPELNAQRSALIERLIQREMEKAAQPKK